MALQLVGTLGGGGGTPGVGIPTGGTTGQVLAKSSNANYATQWITITSGGEFDGTADDILDGTTKVMMLASERSKLSGVAASATANATNAQLRDRATHTGEQAISTITNLQTSLDTLTSRALPTGGTTGQVLAKASNTNYATGWVTALQGLNGTTGLWKGTQAQYDALGTPVSTVIYVIQG